MKNELYTLGLQGTKNRFNISKGIWDENYSSETQGDYFICGEHVMEEVKCELEDTLGFNLENPSKILVISH